jgi:hypothetical protein
MHVPSSQSAPRRGAGRWQGLYRSHCLGQLSGRSACRRPCRGRESAGQQGESLAPRRRPSPRRARPDADRPRAQKGPGRHPARRHARWRRRRLRRALHQRNSGWRTQRGRLHAFSKQRRISTASTIHNNDEISIMRAENNRTDDVPYNINPQNRHQN